MKKYHSLPAFFLALVLIIGVVSPSALAQGEDFSVEAAAAILVDADYNEVLFEQHADELRYPASITKVMTGLLAIEAVDRGELSMDQSVVLDENLYIGIGEGGSTQNLKAGEVLTVRDLLYCALLPSANEACNALAVAVSGSIPAFVDEMNRRAEELDMKDTHFTNTHGYHDDSHYTTARDVAKLCVAAMKHPDFRTIVSSVSYTVPATIYEDGSPASKKRELHDTNLLISNFLYGRSDLLYRYAIGIKTGSTPEAGFCLASAAEKNGRMMIAVVLGGANWRTSDTNYFTESRRLLEHGFNDFSRKEVLSSYEPIDTIPVTLCAQQDYITVQPGWELEATLPNSLDPAVFHREVTLPETLEAPIAKGQVLGTISLSYDGVDYGTVDLIATTGLERSRLLYTISVIKAIFSRLWVKLLLLAVVLLVLILVLRRMVFGSRKRRYGKPKTYASNYKGRRK